MREVLQSLRSSTTELADGVIGHPPRGHILIRSSASLVSAGTERMLIDFAHAGIVGKARQQPERVRQVTEKMRTDGLAVTLDAIRSRLDEPVALGYANCGRVEEVGPGVSGYHVGDLVASNGPHAEFVSVAATLAAVVPDGVDPEEAAFGTIGAIALEGIRLAAPSLGERFVVTGLGLVGLLTAQLLRAHGCEVLGIDVIPARLKLAERFGCTCVLAGDDPVAVAEEFSRGRGADGAIITASSKSSAPVHEAAQMCRRRGRIVLVGVTGLELKRADFYEKELSFQVSCSYGPGRYDPSYESDAIDYPHGLVRWTAGRNIEAVLDSIAAKRLDVASLITNRFPFNHATDAYKALLDDPTSLGIILQYPSEAPPLPTLLTSTSGTTRAHAPTTTANRVAIIGAGQYATNVMLPALQSAGAVMKVIASSSGHGAAVAARRFGVERATTDVAGVFQDPEVDVIFVLTRHDSHPLFVEQALDANKHVFVEKPLAVDAAGLERVIAAWERRATTGHAPLVGIGFNRRYARITRRMMELLTRVPGPRAVSITVNAGAIPPDHWTHAPLSGGGRIIGEGCHFVDLARHLAGSPITDVKATYIERAGPADSAAITLAHGNGSVSTIGYFANGSKRFPKEEVTVFSGGHVLVNKNFRVLRGYGWPGFRSLRLRKQDKGHETNVRSFLQAARDASGPPIAFEEIIEVAAATILSGTRR